jgi:hypothetical protein
MNQQYLTTDTNLACLLAFMRYKFKFIKDPMGTTFAFSDPGDIKDAVKDFNNHAQVAEAKGLLEMRDTFADEMKGAPKVTVTTPHGDRQELVKADIPTVEGKTWHTRDIPSAAILSLRGYELLDIELEGARAQFYFAWDSDLTNIIAKFNNHELLVEPHAFESMEFELRQKLREKRGY